MFKTHCKGESHISKTANIILPGILIKQRRTHRRNHVCQIFCQSFRGYRVLTPQNRPFPLTCYVALTAVRHCEKVLYEYARSPKSCRLIDGGHNSVDIKPAVSWRNNSAIERALSAAILQRNYSLETAQVVLDPCQTFHKQAVLEAAPSPVILTFDLLTLKIVSESRVTWANSVPILVFL